jgi:hypothetical protein
VRYHLSSAHVLAKYSHVPSFEHIARQASATVHALKKDLEAQVRAFIAPRRGSRRFLASLSFFYFSVGFFLYVVLFL